MEKKESEGNEGSKKEKTRGGEGRGSGCTVGGLWVVSIGKPEESIEFWLRGSRKDRHTRQNPTSSEDAEKLGKNGCNVS